jgi:hypothetical protein
MKKIIYLIMLSIFISCGNSASESKIEKLLVSDYKNKLSYQEGELNGGIAIMGYFNESPMAAFWINNKIVYAADGSAMSWTNNKISYAPTGIDFFTVQKAVEEK